MIGKVNSRDYMIKILNEHSIFRNEGDFTDIYIILMKKFDEYSKDAYVRQIIPKENLQIGVFFFIEGKFAFSGCEISEAENDGDFLIFPKSHSDVWNKYKYLRFKNLQNLQQVIDYDYYPRGKVIYRQSDETFIIQYDKCVECEINRISDYYIDYKIILESDEHYCCHECNYLHQSEL